VARLSTPNLIERFSMSDDYRTLADRFQLVLDDLYHLDEQLFGTCELARQLVASLDRAHAEAGIQPATHPEIGQIMDLLRLVLAEHEFPDEGRPHCVAELATMIERLRRERKQYEE
jgi:hypothetical protein